MRQMVTCVVYEPVPSIMGNFKRPWHAGFLQCHLMGIERGMYRGDLLSGRFNDAVAAEFLYDRAGLVTRFALN